MPRRRPEDEHAEILRDLVKAVVDARAHEDDRPRRDLVVVLAGA
jgi:hypothetical protein